MTSHSRRIAEFAAGLRLDNIPAEVIARAKGLILDGLGCGLFAADVEWTRKLAKVVERLEPNGGQASVWGRGTTASAVNATLINGTAVQGYELDDGNQACFHACAVVLPAVFAAAEVVGADRIDGRKVLTAIIAGFEIGPRIGLCLNGDEMIVKGWHSPGIFGPFAASVAAGIVLGLDADQHYHALGMSGTQASGLMSAQFGSMIKRVQCAKNAQSGLYSALLAAEGFTGIEDVLERDYGGFCTTLSQTKDGFDLNELSAGLGTHWETMKIDFKRFAALGTNFSAVDAVEELMQEEGLRAADVDEITVRATQATVKHGGWAYEPKGLTSAQMNLGFCIAMQLIEGDVFVDQMVEANVARPDVVALANRVKAARNPEREKLGRDHARGCDVDVRLKDGRTMHRRVDFFVGSHHRPLTDAQIVDKYRKLASKTLPAASVSAIEEAVWGIDRVASIAELCRLLRN